MNFSTTTPGHITRCLIVQGQWRKNWKGQDWKNAQWHRSGARANETGWPDCLSSHKRRLFTLSRWLPPTECSNKARFVPDITYGWMYWLTQRSGYVLKVRRKHQILSSQHVQSRSQYNCFHSSSRFNPVDSYLFWSTQCTQFLPAYEGRYSFVRVMAVCTCVFRRHRHVL